MAEVVALLEEKVADAGGPRPPVGVGVPGMLDRRGVLRFAPNLQGASGADIGSLVSIRLPDTTLVVENDANCAALAEHRRGAARGADHALVVTLGTGIGGGLISGGRVQVGAHGFAGEVGHMLVDPSGPPVPLRSAGLLGTVRVGGRPGPPGPRGRLRRPAARGGGIGRG